MKSYFTLPALFIVFLFPLQLHGQWQFSHNCNGPTVWSIAQKDTTLLAGGLNGVYFSEDYGATWVLKPCPANFARNIIIRDSVIFVSGDGGIYKSADHGLSWSATSSGITNPAQIWSLSQNDSLLIVGTSGSFGGDTAFIYISADEGNSWNKVLSLGSFDVFYSFAVRGNEVFAGVLPSGVYQSSDKGVTWTLKNGTLAAKHIAFADSNLVCGITGGSGGIYLSDDNGTVWQNVLPVYYGYAFAGNGNMDFAGTTNGFYYSINKGYTWVNDNTGLPPTTAVSAICVTDSFVFIGTTDSKIYKRALSDIGISTDVITAKLPELVLSPNPVTGTITMKGTAATGKISVYDLKGNVILSEKANEVETMIDAGYLHPGIYRLHYEEGRKSENINFLKL